MQVIDKGDSKERLIGAALLLRPRLTAIAGVDDRPIVANRPAVVTDESDLV